MMTKSPVFLMKGDVLSYSFAIIEMHKDITVIASTSSSPCILE